MECEHVCILLVLCRQTRDHGYALIDPPPHPTYDLYQVVADALKEDAGDYGDITTLSTCVLEMCHVIMSRVACHVL